MSSDSVQAMYDGAVSPEVAEKADGIKNHLLNAGNHICVSCGGEMIGDISCYQCPKCGSKDCGS